MTKRKSSRRVRSVVTIVLALLACEGEGGRSPCLADEIRSRWVVADLEREFNIDLPAITEDDACTPEDSFNAMKRMRDDITTLSGLTFPIVHHQPRVWDVCGGTIERSPPQDADICACAAAYYGILSDRNDTLTPGIFQAQEMIGREYLRLEAVLPDDPNGDLEVARDSKRLSSVYQRPISPHAFFVGGPSADSVLGCYQLGNFDQGDNGRLEVKQTATCLRRLWLPWKCDSMTSFDVDDCPDVSGETMRAAMSEYLERFYGERGARVKDVYDVDITWYGFEDCTTLMEGPNLELAQLLCRFVDQPNSTYLPGLDQP